MCYSFISEEHIKVCVEYSVSPFHLELIFSRSGKFFLLFISFYFLGSLTVLSVHLGLILQLLSFLSYSLSMHYCLMIWQNFINYLPLFTYGHVVCFGYMKSWFSKNHFSLFSDHSFSENTYLVSWMHFIFSVIWFICVCRLGFFSSYIVCFFHLLFLAPVVLASIV